MDGQGAPLRDEAAIPRLVGALDVPVAQPTDLRALLPFASMFTPAEAVGMTKRRMGAQSDGGYVMLDDFSEPSIALSLGVGCDTSWDRHMADLGAVVHQYDHTVEKPEALPEAVRFHQKRIVDVADGGGVTLVEALAALDAEHTGRSAILKIDIEGDEWSVLDVVPDDVLDRFDQIVCEYHDFERVGDAAWFTRASRVMAKLDRLFQVVHVHGNNHKPIMMIDDTPFPWVLEVTHASRRRYTFRSTDDQFPTKLDNPNHPDRPDLWLGTFSFGRSGRSIDRPPSPMPDDRATPLVSHARNGEDIVLHRALREIEEGHYVDIGADDPETDSATKMFYDRGWSGINVEPSKTRFGRIEAGRPRDLNLHAAAATRAGIGRFRDADEASEAEQGGAMTEGIDVPALSLADICRNIPFAATHFLRINVGSDARDVLLGADFATFRPWIVIVAAAHSGGAQRTDAGWRGLLEDAGYGCTLFDGANLWFLAQEHAHLRDRLEAPANVHDDYVPVRLKRAEAAGSAASERIARLSAELAHSRSNSAVQAAERASAEGLSRGERSLARSIQAERDRLASDVQRTAGNHEIDLRRLSDDHKAELQRLSDEMRRLSNDHKAELQRLSDEPQRLSDDHKAELQRLSDEMRRVLDDHDAKLQRLSNDHNAELRWLAQDVLEARLTLRVVQEKLERELDGVRREGRLEVERHFAELAEARDQLAGLAHFKAQGELLRQISDLTGAGSHLEKRGGELIALRVGLIEQANAWQTEVEHLQGRLGDALALCDLMYTSTSWRVTSPLRGLRQAGHVLRREPHRLPGLIRHRARGLLGRSGFPDDPSGPSAAGPATSSVERGTRALLSVAARLDGEMAIVADLLGAVSGVLGDDASNAAGPSYDEARLDERLTRWILADVVRQRRDAL